MPVERQKKLFRTEKVITQCIINRAAKRRDNYDERWKQITFREPCLH